jgi:beta-glucosidase
VPELICSDGPHGVRRLLDVTTMPAESFPATCFPRPHASQPPGTGRWLKKWGRRLAEESIALDVGIILGPSNNMKRTPLCGRNFEYYAEDPFLSGALTTGYINGVQSKGVGASLKHFAANNQEFQRFTISARWMSVRCAKFTCRPLKWPLSRHGPGP